MEDNDIACAIDSGMRSGVDYLVERLSEIIPQPGARIRELEAERDALRAKLKAVTKDLDLMKGQWRWIKEYNPGLMGFGKMDTILIDTEQEGGGDAT